MNNIINRIVYYWKRIKTKKHPFKYIVGKLLALVGFSHLFFINKDGYRLRFFPTALSLLLWSDPRQRTDDTLVFRKYLKKGDVVIDVGANIGSIALAASVIVGNKGKVYAFEANPKIFGFLKKNILLNRQQNVICYNYAVGERNDVIYFSDSKSDDMNRIIEDPHALTVEMIALDNVIPKHERIKLLKIDVEGYEKYVIEGATHLLTNVECILFEADEQHYKNYGYSFREIYEILKRHEFKIYRYSGREHCLISLNENYKIIKCCNLLAIKDKKNR